MKKFFIRSAVLCLPFIIVLTAVISFPLPEYSYLHAILDKRQNLADIPGRRLVLLGGSNLAFGIDSAAIQERLHIPVINMGLHGDIGLGRMLDDPLPLLRAGDIAVIIPEYQHFTELWNGDSTAYEVILITRQYRLLFSFNYGLPKDFPELFSGHLQARTAPSSPPDDTRAYLRTKFNKYGDYIGHLGERSSPFQPGEKMASLNASYLRHFFHFIDQYERHGITVLFSYPSYEEQSYRASAALIGELDSRLRKKKNLQVISRPETYCFPTDLFYDTTYHLAAEGRKLRTELLIQDLEASGVFF